MATREMQSNNEEQCDARTMRGWTRPAIVLAVGVLPHLVISALVLKSYWGTDCAGRDYTCSVDRQFSALPVLMEVLVLPVTLVIATTLILVRRTRAIGWPTLGTTMASGLATVVLACWVGSH